MGRAAAHLGVGGAAGPQISGRQGRGVISHPLTVPVSVCCRSSRGPYTWWWCDSCPHSTPPHHNPSPEHQQVWCPGVCFGHFAYRCCGAEEQVNSSWLACKCLPTAWVSCSSAQVSATSHYLCDTFPDPPVRTYTAAPDHFITI